MPPLSSAELLYIQERLEVAGLDMAAAERMFADDPSAFDYHVPFSCQQAVEKYCKAIILVQGKKLCKTHDLPSLLQQLLPQEVFSNAESEDADLLSDYAVDTRYPPKTKVSVTEMQEALRIAHYFQLRLRPIILAVLP